MGQSLVKYKHKNSPEFIISGMIFLILFLFTSGILHMTFAFPTHAAAEDFSSSQTQQESFFQLTSILESAAISRGAVLMIVVMLIVLMVGFSFVYGVSKMTPLLMVGLLTGGLFISVSTLNNQQMVQTSANEDAIPRSVEIVVNGNSAVVSWATSSTTIGGVSYGRNPGEFSFTEVSAESNSVTAHRVELSGLDSGLYYFSIISDGSAYEDATFIFEIAPVSP